MKKNASKVLLLIAGLMICGSVSAQVAETKTYKDGSVYTGQFNGRGKKEGQGRMVWSNGNQYEGQWKKDMPNGEGTFTYANGIVYQGQWVNNVAKGHGIITMPNGASIDGEWTEMGTGTGVMTWADGTRYVGSFKDGAPHGQGEKIWPNGDRYEGNFLQGHMSGQGTLTTTRGVSYTGGWLNDQFEGKGKYVAVDGSVMEGTFHAGKFQQ